MRMLYRKLAQYYLRRHRQVVASGDWTYSPHARQQGCLEWRGEPRTVEVELFLYHVGQAYRAEREGWVAH